MKAIIVLLTGFYFAPTLALAQSDEFQKEFMKANEQFVATKSFHITQKYIFSWDSSSNTPFDSGICTLQKDEKSTRSMFNGIESFTDSSYIIKLTTIGKQILVSKNSHPDQSAINLVLIEGLSRFTKYEKKRIDDVAFSWDLTGGSDGITSLRIIFDSREGRIRTVLSELSPGHPLVLPFNKKKAGRFRKMFIKVEYTYSEELTSELPKFSDYIHVKQDVITPAEKFKGYEVKFIK